MSSSSSKNRSHTKKVPAVNGGANPTTTTTAGIPGSTLTPQDRQFWTFVRSTAPVIVQLAMRQGGQSIGLEQQECLTIANRFSTYYGLGVVTQQAANQPRQAMTAAAGSG